MVARYSTGNRRIDTGLINVIVAGLFSYPVKSFRACSRQSLTMGIDGLHNDRRWMVVNQRGEFLSQRQLPKMATIGASLTNGQLQLELPSGANRRVAVPDAAEETISVSVWQDSCAAQSADEDVNDWLSTYLGRSCRLVYLPVSSRRGVQGFATQQVGFADGYPLLLTSTASLHELNQRLMKKGIDAVSMNRFRPNLVVEGDEALTPFAEDGWASLSINGIRLVNAKPCGRCMVTTVDQQSGEKQPGREPLTTLSEFRTDSAGEVLFGINLVPEVVGTEPARLSVGDRLQIQLR